MRSCARSGLGPPRRQCACPLLRLETGRREAGTLTRTGLKRRSSRRSHPQRRRLLLSRRPPPYSLLLRRPRRPVLLLLLLLPLHPRPLPPHLPPPHLPPHPPPPPPPTATATADSLRAGRRAGDRRRWHGRPRRSRRCRDVHLRRDRRPRPDPLGLGRLNDRRHRPNLWQRPE